MRWDEPELYEMASDFFRTFSRMEYALKATGFFGKDKRRAEADWTRFAEEVQEALAMADEEVRKAVDFILSEPPKKQVIVDGRLQWDSTPPSAEDEADRVLLYVRRVRNNLFHGGKFNGHWFQPERSGELMKASLIILNFCRESCPDVSQAFYEESA